MRLGVVGEVRHDPRHEHRGLLTLWLEGYARSLVERDGAWAGFGVRTVDDWLAVLAEVSVTDRADATLLLAVLRGVLLDLLATGDVERTGAAVERLLDMLSDAG